MQLKKDLDKLFIKTVIPTSNGKTINSFIIVDLTVINEIDIIKNAYVLNEIRKIMTEQDKDKLDLVQSNFNGLVYMLLEDKFSNDDKMIKKKYDEFNELFDRIFLTSNIVINREEKNLNEYVANSNISELKDHLKGEMLLFFVLYLLSSFQPINGDQKICGIEKQDTLYLSSLGFTDFDSLLNSLKTSK